MFVAFLEPFFSIFVTCFVSFSIVVNVYSIASFNFLRNRSFSIELVATKLA